MDEEMTNEVSETEEGKSAVSADSGKPAGEERAAETPNQPPAKPAPPLDLNELQDYSTSDLHSLASELDLRLYAARSRHQHILDLVRAALDRGSIVTTEGFLEQVEAVA